MVGSEVSSYVINAKSCEAALALRTAFDKVETLAKWLADNPNDPVNGDPLVTVYNYTADEAYILRFTFETFDAIRTNNAAAFDTARKLTGLE